MKRRDFIKNTVGGMAALVVGSHLPGVLQNQAYAATRTLNFTITDVMKEMVDYNANYCTNPYPANNECYFWCFKEANLPADIPGPTIYAQVGDYITVNVTNELDEPHAFVVEGLVNTGAIAPGATVTKTFKVVRAGTFLYYDNLNAPVNRVMGLYGCFIAMPAAASGASWTPYDAANVTPQVQQLFDDFGSAPWWPGLRWQDGNAATLTPPYRQVVWLTSQASPNLFAEVGSLAPGVLYDPRLFADKFQRDAWSNNPNNNCIPQYFMVNGQSGHFCHNNPCVVPMARVGEPMLVRVLNPGLMSHSMHLHCNHFYMLSVDGVVQGTPVGAGASSASLLHPGMIWIDTFTLNRFGQPAWKYDMIIPFMRPPDVPNQRGIGRGGSPDAALLSLAGQPVYPPFEEFNVWMPEKGTMAKSPIDGVTPVPIAVRQSPLCYPMHDHSEASQTASGGNYNCGLIAGMYVIGDQNVTLPRFNVNDDPAMPLLPPQTFPMDEDFHMMIVEANGSICYGCDEARVTGMMEASRESQLMSQEDRPTFPPPFPPV